ncbi:PRC-barrel domain-containing protein [Fictibacillus gelatini]|uniref:PRC-barrel domain-containing protein n=1 Tax=Fictibacillus gelatini TaxID=225985 RepID=UPI00047BAF5D|nr:PRC-barrel domain-containing protein [Fictibacillus gelatini]
MRTFSLLKRISVIDQKSQKSAGKVEDIFIDQTGKVHGFVICKQGFFARKCFVSFSDVSFPNDQTMFVSECRMSPKGFKEQRLKPFFTMTLKPRFFLKQPIYSNEGETVAVIEDVYFSTDWGTIVAIEVTEGLFSDLMEGRKLKYANQPLLIGKNSFFVR